MPAGEARRKDDRMVRRLRLKLLSVLALLGVLAAGSYLLFRAQSAALGSSARVVNLCGRQRMLSQRAALLMGHLEAATNEAERQRVRAELGQIANTMEEHARRLLGGGPALAPPLVRAQVLEANRDLPAILRRFVDGVRAAADPARTGAVLDDPRITHTLRAARDGTVLEALEHVVEVMQEESEGGIRRLRRAQLTAVGLFLATLGGLILFVFRPVLRDLRRHLAELRRSREALREQREQLQLNFESAPLGIARCSSEGRLLSVNPALCRVLGASSEELVGQRIEGLLHGDDYPRLAEALRQARDEEGSRDAMSLRLRHRDGSWVAGLLHWNPVVDSDGLAMGWIAHFEDRTRQLLAEEQARQDREQLAKLGRLHTLGEMAAGIAHEVNQPLTAIANYTQASRRLLQAGPTDTGLLAETLDKVAGQAYRAGEVIRGLRGFVRNRRSRSERVDLNALVRQAVDLAKADADFVSVAVETRLEPGIPEVVADPVQIQQVIVNLILNALDAVGETGGRTPVVVGTSANGSGFVEVAVEDRGPGIGPEAAARLFEPFFTSKESGLGMGLAISRSIVTSHGGRIWWTAVEKGGTVFHFILPAAADAPLPTEAG
jgi:PAS domain S-box-containing protein